MKLNISIVTYNSEKVIGRCLKSIIDVTKDVDYKIIVIDNNSQDDTVGVIKRGFSDVDLIENSSNIGFGKAHNMALRESESKYHLILNPDITFSENSLKKILDFMGNNPDVGLVMPKVLYPDGEIQYLCKFLPNPLDWFIRHFLRFSFIKEKHDDLYELRFTGYDKIMNVPYLSGCFMLVSMDALERVGFFDERFFMYIEDTDLSRRIHKHYRTVYYPKTTVYHEFERGSRKDYKLLIRIISSAIKYFNKWGWVLDNERTEINRRTLEKLKVQT